ncbi:MAG: hypothetical protein AAFN93_24610 [Bacteroidota bacterium]
MSTCVTNKRCYDSREIAEEALIENRSRYHHSSKSGPINVYLCELCGCYHFTSKGEQSDILKSQESKKRIDLQREANFWESKSRR